LMLLSLYLRNAVPFSGMWLFENLKFYISLCCLLVMF
jgi:hypothetical protein